MMFSGMVPSPGFQSRFFVLANENRTQDAGHALLRQGRNPKVRKNSGVINLSESKKLDLKHAIDEDRLFPVQRDSDNGVIPYQLHRNELRRILEKQGKSYPFLLDTFEKNGEQVNKLEGLLTFRVP
ncbi:MAG: CRISPR-associated endonuclease Cas9 REC1/REC2 domain-containing protein, partial [Bifidobacterium adolescentis]